MAEKVIADIGKDHSLKHADTVDKSGPKIESDVHIKKVDRSGLLNDIASDHSLKHADTVDKSTPKIEGEQVNLKKVDRGALLADIKKDSKE